jgi:hypothetical protein
MYLILFHSVLCYVHYAPRMNTCNFKLEFRVITVLNILLFGVQYRGGNTGHQVQ